MNTQNKFRSATLIFGVLSVLTITVQAIADDTESLATSESSAKVGRQTTRPPTETEQAWGFTLRPIDSWMRMHLMLPPMLGPVGEDLIVESIQPGSSAEIWNLEVGDVILESDRGPIGRSEQMGMPEEIQFFRILRRGAPNMVHRKPWAGRNPVNYGPMMGRQVPMPPQAPITGQNQIGTSASSYSSGGSAVAISQVGNQIQIEVSENGVRNQFRGTAASIRQQIAGTSLSRETRNKITAALQRMAP